MKNQYGSAILSKPNLKLEEVWTQTMEVHMETITVALPNVSHHLQPPLFTQNYQKDAGGNFTSASATSMPREHHGVMRTTTKMEVKLK